MRSQWAMFLFFLMCEEWGDKSQIAAIALSANYGVVSIVLGGGLAHLCCIAIAILLGGCVEKILDERKLTLIGGILFIGFGLFELIWKVILDK